MPELSGTIKFQVPGTLDDPKPHLTAVSKEIEGLRKELIPNSAKLSSLSCRVEDEVTNCSVKWEEAPFFGTAAR